MKKKAILEFHIGKWDNKKKYYPNGGGLFFRGETSGIRAISDFQTLSAPCFKNGKEKKMGKSEFKDEMGKEVGLTVEMANSGIGVINFDGQYDTVYTKFLDKKLTEKEIQAIFNSGTWLLDELLKYFTQSELEFMGWEFEEEKKEETF